MYYPMDILISWFHFYRLYEDKGPNNYKLFAINYTHSKKFLIPEEFPFHRYSFSELLHIHFGLAPKSFDNLLFVLIRFLFLQFFTHKKRFVSWCITPYNNSKSSCIFCTIFPIQVSRIRKNQPCPWRKGCICFTCTWKRTRIGLMFRLLLILVNIEFQN